MLEHGADTLLRLLLFWNLFLPLGAQWSVEVYSRRRRGLTAAKAAPVNHVAAMGLLLQVVCVYWCTVLIKAGPQWHAEGTAVYYILAADQFIKPLGLQLLALLRAYPWATAALTHASFYTELLAPFLLLAPRQRLWLRGLGLLLLASLHVGLALSLELGLFPLIDLVSLLVFIPTEFWQLGQRQSGKLANAAAVLVQPRRWLAEVGTGIALALALL